MDTINLTNVIKTVIYSCGIKRNQNSSYRIVIPFLGSRIAKGRTSVIKPKKYRQEGESICTEYYGNTYLIDYDFHDYNGKKNNKEDIDAYLLNYKRIIIDAGHFRYTVYSKKIL